MAKGTFNFVFELIISSLLIPIGILYMYTAQYVNITVGGTSYVLGTVVNPTIVLLITFIGPLAVAIRWIRSFFK